MPLDDPYTAEQLKAPRVNKLIVRPLVDQYYNPSDISISKSSGINHITFIR